MLRASRPPFVIAMQQCSGGTICSASCIIFGISSIEDGCFECSKFHVDINFRYLGFDHSFRCWTKELLFRGGFSKVGGVVTTRWILLGGVVISRQILRVWRIIEAPTCWRRITEAPACGWRIIEAPTCWLEDYRASCLFGSLCRYFCLLQRHDLIDSSIGTAVDFVAGYLG